MRAFACVLVRVASEATALRQPPTIGATDQILWSNVKSPGRGLTLWTRLNRPEGDRKVTGKRPERDRKETGSQAAPARRRPESDRKVTGKRP